MTKLRIGLRDGFRDDMVRILVDGREVYQKPHVTTNLAISFADAVELHVDAATVEVEIEVNGRDRARKAVRAAETPYLDVWYIDGTLQLRESAREIPML